MMTRSAPTLSTLVELLGFRAAESPLRTGYTFLASGETEETALTYGELDRMARAIAARIKDLAPAGERALLLYPPGLEFIAGFFGCLYAGVVAVPAYPARNARGLPRLRAIVKDASATVALTTSPILAQASRMFDHAPDLQALKWVASDAVDPSGMDDERPRESHRESLAFIQYTSGSTGTPKGVMLTHGNLLHNASLVFNAVEHQPEDKYVSWLPTFHDMGFMAGVLQPLYAGIPVILMSPASFLQSPIRWLSAISRYKATTSGAPNFAYDLCVRKISPEHRAELDLSTWSVAFNGAEPIRANTLDGFVSAFGPYGFRRESFFPCYGLAEATLIVSGCPKSASPPVKVVRSEALQSNRVVPASARDEDHLPFVGSGVVLGDQRVAIVNPESLTRCSQGEVGEIWVAGPSVAQGYWDNPEGTASTFRASIADTGEGPFLRTGDLGFADGHEIYVTGRLKDLIIIRGRNHYPQDIELTVEQSHPGLRPGCGAAFSVDFAGDEQLVVVQEVEERSKLEDFGENLQEVIAAIRQAVAEGYELQPQTVVLIKAGTIPKTSSGKIQRHACRKQLLSNSLEVVAEWRADAGAEAEVFSRSSVQLSKEDLQSWLVLRLAARLGVPAAEIDVNQPITRYGIDSLTDVELVQSVETALGVVLPAFSFLQGSSIAEVAAQIQGSSGGSATVELRAGERRAEYPLSHGQRALWFLYQLAPESAAYNIIGAARIKTSLDADALDSSLQKVVERHACLRASFYSSEQGPIQRVPEEVRVASYRIDASSWSEDALQRALVEEGHRPFDLERGPLLRVALFNRSDREQILLLAVHHIVADLWSLAVILRELGVEYTAETGGARSGLPMQPVEYSDFVQWQADLLSGPEGERLLDYWSVQLAGDLPVLNLPTDRPRPRVQTFRGASRLLNLDQEITDGLKRLASENGATLYMVLLAAFQSLLNRYTSQEDILTGCPTAGRHRSGLGGLVGYLVNPVVIRSDLSGDPTFAEFLAQVRQTVLGAFEHQDYPFPLLVERLQPERDPGRSPLFQAMFVLETMPLPELEGLGAFALGCAGAEITLGALTLESISLDQEIAQFDLTLMAAQVKNRLALALQYNSDLFAGETIERMLGHLNRLLEGIVSTPARSLSALPLLTEQEARQLLFDWAGVRRELPTDLCTHHLFEQQVERTPNAIAIQSDEHRLTYRELNAQANRLANRLRLAGVSADVPVGIFLNRTVDIVVALLGVLKAGGAYVPLDPGYPGDRIEYMLEDAGVRVVVTQESLKQQIPARSAELVCVDDADRQSITDHDGPNLASDVAPANLAYVIYTSGSTGKPKGVALTHLGVVTLLHWATEVFPSEALSGVLASTSICFDISVFEIFAPLSWGGSVILAEDALHLMSLKSAGDVTLVNTVPSAAAELVSAGALPPSLQVLNCAGEVLTRDVVERAYAQCPEAKVFDLYGPSEDTVYSTFALRRPAGPVTIGRPVLNTDGYILDSSLQPVPIGVAGELHVGGDGLARGYLNRPDLTAERFIPNPFDRDGGKRLYKTGDLARYRPDGNIEFIGRIDHQVKIRGFRIELGEIESILRRHVDVREAVVTASDNQLVAYVAPFERQTLTISEMRAYLKERLPDHMVPGFFVLLDALPRTPSGKLDRKSLPPVDRESLLAGTGYVAPRGPVEEIVAGVWADILGLMRVGIYENFFEVGGTSLLAVQVVTRLRSALEVELPLRNVFEWPTVEGLAGAVERILHSEGKPVVTQLAPVSRETSLPPSFAQERLWFIDQFQPGSYAYNMPGGIRLVGKLDVAALEQSLREVLRRHEALRTTFALLEGRCVQVVADNVEVDLKVDDATSEPEEQWDAYLRNEGDRESRQPFDLNRGPLLRARLVRLNEEHHVLFVTMHHIVSDGWSLDVLWRELLALYDAFASDSPSPLPELPIQYADFAVWQRQWLQGEALESLLSYWKENLSGELPVLQLPTDHPRPANLSVEGAKEILTLPKGLSEDVKTLSRRAGSTLFLTMLAAMKTLLHRYSGQDDLIIATPVANRSRGEIEGLIGFFVNTLVLRTDLSGDPRFRELLTRVRTAAMGAYAHQDMPFERLVEELQPERDPSRNPLFQAMAAVEDPPFPTTEVSGVVWSPLEVGGVTTKWIDLVLNVIEGDEALTLSLDYSTDLFEAATMVRMLGHLRTLLEEIVKNPSQRISRLPMLTESERRQMLLEWNDTFRDFPPDACLHELIEETAHRLPNAWAVIAGDDWLTYGELDRRANQLGNYLRRLGVGPETLVGFCVERSPDYAVAALGILKAGGAYVGLDPEYPTDRLAAMMERANAPYLVTERKLLYHLPKTEAQIICIDSDWNQISRESGSKPEVAIDPDNVAVVLYTSGSTGKPKGVMCTHRGLSNHILWVQNEFPMNDEDGMAVKYSICFDASVLELYYPLYAGAKAVMVPQGMQQDLDCLVDLTVAHRITTIDVPSPLLEVLMTDKRFLKCDWLKYVTGGSDSLLAEVKDRLFEMMGKKLVRFYHVYGPCEASVSSTFKILQPGGTDYLVSVGGPVANTTIYVLDSGMQPLPMGLAGEIYIGGTGITRGYLNQPDITAEKFVPDPFAQEPGSRLYRTGDRGRYRPDGDLEFAGRVDYQVKIRGFRIELGDIQAALLEHPSVREAVVVARVINGMAREPQGLSPNKVALVAERFAESTEPEAQSDELVSKWREGPLSPSQEPNLEIAGSNVNSGGTRVSGKEARNTAHRAGDSRGVAKRLVAYVVPDDGTVPSAGELRNFLAKRLPDYMLPAAYVAVDAFPLTSSGKIDRDSLPPPPASASEQESEYVAPRSDVEEVIASIWGGVLGLEKIGAHNNFFSLGGHSVAAAQVVYRIRDLFQVELPIRTLFEGPTVAELTAALIAREPKPGRTDKIASAYKRVKSMSTDEKQRLLQEKRAVKSN